MSECGVLFLSRLRALPTETKVECGTSQSRRGTSVNLGESEKPVCSQLCGCIQGYLAHKKTPPPTAVGSKLVHQSVALGEEQEPQRPQVHLVERVRRSRRGQRGYPPLFPSDAGGNLERALPRIGPPPLGMISLQAPHGGQ